MITQTICLIIDSSFSAPSSIWYQKPFQAANMFFNVFTSFPELFRRLICEAMLFFCLTFFIPAPLKLECLFF
jgi:hypothetical protein